MCGCAFPLLGLWLMTNSSSPAGQTLGAVLIGLGLLRVWADRLAGGGARRVRWVDLESGRTGDGPFGGVFGGRTQGAGARGGPFGGGSFEGNPRAASRGGMRLDPASAAFFGLLGIIAKSDGRVSQQEIDALDPILENTAQGRGEIREAAIEAFREGRDHPEHLRQYVRDLFGGIGGSQIDGLFELFCQLTVVDGQMGPDERKTLESIERMLFGTTTRTQRYAGNRGSAGGSQRASTPRTEEDPHVTFGLPNPTTRAAIKKRYRELVKLHHPDRVRGRGVPEEAVRAAEVQMRKINVARDALLDRYGESGHG